MEADKLKDYSGPFTQGISWDDFSRETLVQALGTYAGLFPAIDGFWYLSVKDRFGEEPAFDCDFWVWDKYFRYETKRLTKLFGITGNDVETYFKVFQLSPVVSTQGFKLDLFSKQHGVLKVHRCPTLEALIKEGEGREQRFCKRVEQKMLEMQAHAINPDITVNGLCMPPETIGGEICCEWEFKL
ncbi:MAG: hypothetical protein EPO21_11215 [Chloroflexota bacterium]|nr:MAG: hypothetical protein EPO21_11215 [Chloroflexota bacterium]